MKDSLLYRLSLGFSILLSLAAFITLLGWAGSLSRAAGSASMLALAPWTPIGLVALAAVNCTVRARVILRKGEKPASA